MSRADRVAERLEAGGVDLLLISDLTNLRYVTGFSGSNGAALVGAEQRTFLTDFRYLTQADEEVGDAFEREIASTDLFAGVVAKLPEEGALRLGFDDATMSVKAHAHLRELLRDDVELVPAGGLIEE